MLYGVMINGNYRAKTLANLFSQKSSSHKDNENEGSNSLFVGHDIALL